MVDFPKDGHISSLQDEMLLSNEALEASSDIHSLLTLSLSSSLSISAANAQAHPLSEQIFSYSNLSSSVNSTMDISSEDELG